MSALNRVLIPVLLSRFGHRLGRRLAVIEYAGRRTGHAYRLVTQYRRDGGAVRIDVGWPERKTWWRNFEKPHHMHLHLAGVAHEAVATAVRKGGVVRVVAELEPAWSEVSLRR